MSLILETLSFLSRTEEDTYFTASAILHEMFSLSTRDKRYAGCADSLLAKTGMDLETAIETILSDHIYEPNANPRGIVEKVPYIHHDRNTGEHFPKKMYRMRKPQA